MDAAMTLLLDGIDEAFGTRAWHGPNLTDAIRGVTAAGAEWRPARGRHTIHELVVHCAFWKRYVRRLLSAALPGRAGLIPQITRAKQSDVFPWPGSNWFEPSPKEWARNKA